MKTHSIGNKIKEARNERGVSRATLVLSLYGAGLRVAPETIKNWEDGKTEPNAKDIQHLCEALEKPVLYFFNQDYKQRA